MLHKIGLGQIGAGPVFLSPFGLGGNLIQQDCDVVCVFHVEISFRRSSAKDAQGYEAVIGEIGAVLLFRLPFEI